MIEKIPGGSTKLGTYAAGLFLIKEEIDTERLLNEGESYVEELLQEWGSSSSKKISYTKNRKAVWKRQSKDVSYFVENL